MKRGPNAATTTGVVRSEFTALLADVKGRIQSAQTRAVLAVNQDLVRLYWDVGRIISERQGREGWGTAVIPRLARALHNELPELKGFSERNIGRMVVFFKAYPDPTIVEHPAATAPAASILPQPAAKMDALLWMVPWFHHVILLEKVKDLPTRRWYMEQTLANGWSRNILALQIASGAHARRGKLVSNFATTLPGPQSDLLAEYSFAGMEQPIGVSTYELTRALPKGLRSALPTVEEIEAELSASTTRRARRGKKD